VHITSVNERPAISKLVTGCLAFADGPNKAAEYTCPGVRRGGEGELACAKDPWF